MDRIWQPLLLAFTYTQKLHAVIPEDEPKRRGRISRAREELASRVTAQIRDLPHEAQEGAPDFEELTRHPHRRIAGEISDLDLAAMLAALMGTWPLAPFEREIDRKRATEALLDVCDRVRDPSLETSAISDRGFADGADQARRIARRAIDVDAKYPEPMWTQNLANETFRDLALSGASPFHDHAPAVIDAAFGPAGMTAGMHYALALRPVALGNEVGGRSHEPQESTVHRLRVTNQIISQTCLSMGRTPTRTLLMSLMASIALQDRLLPDLDQTPTRQTLVSVAEALTREYEIHSEIAPDADKTHDIRKKLRAAEAALRCFTQIPEEVDERAPRWRFQPPR